MSEDEGTRAKAEFTTNPLGYAKGEDPPREWVCDGWRNAEFRDAVTYMLARSVSKVGSFSLAGDWLRWLADAITAEDAADLYSQIRDDSERLECEWRHEFEVAFPNSVLPSSRDEEVVVGLLREMVESGAGQGFEGLVNVLVKLPAATREFDSDNPMSLISRARELRRGVMLSILEEACSNAAEE